MESHLPDICHILADGHSSSWMKKLVFTVSGNPWPHSTQSFFLQHQPYLHPLKPNVFRCRVRHLLSIRVLTMPRTRAMTSQSWGGLRGNFVQGGEDGGVLFRWMSGGLPCGGGWQGRAQVWRAATCVHQERTPAIPKVNRRPATVNSQTVSWGRLWTTYRGHGPNHRVCPSCHQLYLLAAWFTIWLCGFEHAGYSHLPHCHACMQAFTHTHTHARAKVEIVLAMSVINLYGLSSLLFPSCNCTTRD